MQTYVGKRALGIVLGQNNRLELKIKMLGYAQQHT
jgi:hypothetical protein